MEILYFLVVLTLLAVYNFIEKRQRTSVDIGQESNPTDTDIILNNEENFDDVWEKSGKFEGDIILNDAQKEVLSQSIYEDGGPRNSVKNITRKWPDGVLVYKIKKDNFSTAQLYMIDLAFYTIKQASCVRFRESSSEDVNVVVIVGKEFGCTSLVGFQGGEQYLNLDPTFPAGSGCFSVTTIVHELLHALGFYHMHSNPNRDEYVKVEWNNIKPKFRSMFHKVSSKLASDFGLEYDYQSIMHYSQTAFSQNGNNTITPIKEGAVLKKTIPISYLDLKKLKLLYCT